MTLSAIVTSECVEDARPRGANAVPAKASVHDRSTPARPITRIGAILPLLPVGLADA
jgi:hypothetical protein